jgi:hypothetical protein
VEEIFITLGKYSIAPKIKKVWCAHIKIKHSTKEKGGGGTEKATN